VRRVIRILAISYISYLALVLLAITPALNLLPPWLAKKYLDRELHSEIIWFNPFTLSLEMRKIELPEHDGAPFFSLERATVDLSLASLWSGALVFDEVSIDQLFVHVAERPDGSFNFSDMLPPDDPQAPPAEAGGIPAVTIGRLGFNAREIIYTREVGAKPTSTSLSEININSEGLSTVLEEGKPYTIDAMGEQGGQLHWRGEVSIPRARSEGTLALTDIQLQPLWRFAQPWLEFELAEGTVAIEGRYRVDWSSGLDYRVSQGEVRLDGIAVRPKAPVGLPDTEVTLGSLKLAGIELDGPAQRLGAQSLAIGELAISGWSDGTQVSLARLFAVNLPPDAGQEPPIADDASPGNPGWTATLDTFRLTDSSARWRSEYTDPARLEVSPLEASANAIKWPFEGATGLKLELTVNGQTSASLEGELDLARGAGSLNYALKDLPLAWFNPNLPSALNARVTDGQLQVAGEVTLDKFAPVTIGMDGAIKGFSGKITGAEDSLTSWETVRWKKLRIDMDKHEVELAKLAIDNYSGRLHINKDGSINAQNVWQQEVGEQAEEVKESLAQGKPWTVSAPLISITDSEIDFMDESLPIHFRTVIGDINGNIANISTAPGTKTEVDIKGSVDGYAPVSLSGAAEPLRSPPALDLELTFAGVDMALLSPYSGTYAGYAIERGVLNLDLKYALEDNQLKGNNKIVIEQMKLGDKIASDKAVDLPLELALALLTDSKGVIDMEIPVGGKVDDPKFNVGRIVMGALVNLITKAVTAPFTLLANLVDSEADLQRLNFKSGSAELQASTREKLDSLAKALAQRPELNLAITGRLQLQADRERLQKNILQAQMMAEGVPEEELSSKGPEWEKAIEARYQLLAPGETGLTVREQYLKLAQVVPLPDSDLLELASARAVAVKSYLVNEAGLSPERAVIGKPNLEARTNLYSGAELEIDT
jgi:uncharacterized protein involved in outer membrane biogenesis